MENLEALVKEIAETEETANLETDRLDYRVRAAFEMAKREAKDKLEGLKKKYTDAIQQGTLGFFVSGPGAEAFAKIGEEEASTLTIRADALYRRLAEPVEPSLGHTREFGVNQMARFLRGLGDVSRELEVTSLVAPKLMESGHLATYEDVVAHIRTMVRFTVGDDLNRIFLSREIAKAALAARYSSPVLPVVFIGLADVEEAQSLEGAVSRFGARVTAPEDVTKEFVIETFSEYEAKKKKTGPNKKKN